MEKDIGYLQIKIRELNEKVEELTNQCKEQENIIKEFESRIQKKFDTIASNFEPILKVNNVVEELIYQSKTTSLNAVNEEFESYKKFIDSYIVKELKSMKSYFIEINEKIEEKYKKNLVEEMLTLHTRINNLIENLNKNGIKIIDTKNLIDEKSKIYIRQLNRVMK